MAYLGNAPARSFISFERQVFTIVNSQTAYTLDHSVNNENDIRLVVNNVVQEPGSGKAYTASGTTLTLSAALTNGTDEMYCVYLGRATATEAPGAGSVGTSQLADSAVTSAKLSYPLTTFSSTGIDDNATSTAMTINSSEQVGIGTTSPAFKLEVNAGSAGDIARFTDGVNANTVIKTSGSVTTFGPDTNNSLAFQQNNTERMRIDTSGNLKFNSGYGSVTTAFGVRAWVKFNGTGTIAITASGNVSSLSDNGTGDYAITFTNALVDANYAHFANSVKGGGAPTSSNSGVGFGIENRTVNGFGVAVGQLDGTIVDRSEVFGCVIR